MNDLIAAAKNCSHVKTTHQKPRMESSNYFSQSFSFPVFLASYQVVTMLQKWEGS